ncbi:SusC/RagA family TonB-linked outer membrane protein [Pedobacter cryotolerans]|uniref:SusC/RagA family TonB-linked outer membrane protein n=1 Tax=Pedobacter cryotolerans TaxID=2571270 RepID=A0A4U1CDY2_9SPHI|nr:SusC/RagA family TonB-linked outer membrane protein [Pedobacter cryotolerans]TKC02394.1 SusC/RagA family TonB-linked outer membrane protein [Pedobacter cryotolerans]
MNSKILQKISLFLLLMLSTSTILFAQVRRITGTVSDASGPIPGVNVALRGMPSNVSTNAQGVYTIQVNSDADVLVFSYVGYVRQQIPVGTKTKIDVTMAADSQELTEVVINVGYGTKKRSETLGSVAIISGEELQDIPSPNIAGAMRNRIAGVGVDQTSGRPGSPITLNIRNSSVSGSLAGQNVGGTSEPLYVVDGITVTRDDFDNIDASMVENISFLKDASAAIYGAAGAKGVVLVTTKRGKVGKIGITYNGYLGLSDSAMEPEMLSGLEHANLLNDTYRISNAPLSSFFLPADLDVISNLNYKSWYDEVWQAALMQRHNVGISGGNDKITFFAGGSFQNENANYAGLTNDRYGFRSGLTATLANGLKADVGFNVDFNQRTAQHSTSDNDANFFERIVSTPRWVPMTLNGFNVNYDGALNPRAILESGYYQNSSTKGYRINTSLTYQPTFLKGFTARVQVSQASGSGKNTQYVPPYQTYNFVRQGNNQQLFTDQFINTSSTSNVFNVVTPQNASITPRVSENNSYQGFITLQYAKIIAKHSFDLLVGGEQSEGNLQNLGVRYTNQLIPEIDQYWAFDATTLARQDFTRNAVSKRSFFGRFNYDFDKKYLLEVISRLDASSNFATGNRWGLAPSVGLGWVASQEKFFKDSKFLSFINFAKLKLNVGITGDDRVAQRLWQNRFLIDVTNGYLYGNSNQNSLNRSRLANPDITWERKLTYNLGLETSMFDNKLDFSVEVFRNYNYDAFDLGGNNLYPQYFGNPAAVINYRETYNWGSEFSIGYRANLTSDLKLSASMNFGYGNSVVDQVLYAQGNLINNVAPDWQTQFGTDPRVYSSSNIGLKTIGMFRTQGEVDAWMAKYPNYRLYDRIPQPGWLYFEDSNNDGVISDSDMLPMFDNTNAFFSSGISLNFSYKNFALNTNINARFGGQVYYDGRARIAPSATRNVLTLWQDRWTPENPNEGRFPRFDDPSLTRNSDFWAEDGTMIRINTMTLSYRAPATFAKKIGLSGARLLLTGNNLWTIVNPLPYKDPYTSSAYDYPMLRTISLGLSVNL